MRKIIALMLIAFFGYCTYTYIINGDNPFSMFVPCDYRVGKDNVKLEVKNKSRDFSFYTKLSENENNYELYYYKLADVNGVSLNTIEIESLSNDIRNIEIPSLVKNDYQEKIKSCLTEIVSLPKNRDLYIYEEAEPRSKYNTDFQITFSNDSNGFFKMIYSMKLEELSAIDNKTIYDEIINKFEFNKNNYTNTRKWSEVYDITANRLEANKLNKSEGYKDKLNGFRYLVNNGFNEVKKLSIKEKTGVTYEAGLYGNFDLYGIIILNNTTNKATYTNNLYLKENGLFYHVNSEKQLDVKYENDSITFLDDYFNYGLIDQSENEVTVSFDTDGGSLVENQKVEYGNKVIKPKDPLKGGYRFDGWYLDKNFFNKFDFNKVIYEDLILYAKWIKTDEFNEKGVVITVGNRNYRNDGVLFIIEITNNTGVTIHGLEELLIEISCDGKIRASGRFVNIQTGPIYNNNKVKHNLVFGFDCIDKKWWDENRGHVKIEYKYKYVIKR